MSITLHPDLLSEEDLYPSSDGEPMAESDLHADEMIYVRTGIGSWFQNRADVYVSGNTFLYYERGKPSAVVSPDLYVVFGVAKRQRDSYQAWKEDGRLPAVVLEITSKSTRQIDIRTEPSKGKNKYRLYEQILKVPEYFLFDPTGDYLEPRLQGYRLVDQKYMPIAPELAPLPNLPGGRQPAYRLHSVQLGLDLTYEGERLRLYDPLSGAPILRPEEALHKAEEERRRAEEERHRAEEEWQRAEKEQQRAQAEMQARLEADLRADQAQQRADAETQARTQAEAELIRLRAELETLRRPQGR